MLPKGTDIRIEEDVLYWENHTDLLTVKEALIISNEIRNLVQGSSLRGMVVDNRKLAGAWSPEVDRVWIDLMAFLPKHDLKTATVCQSLVNKLQFNYLSSQAGTTDTVKAFVDDEREALCRFLQVQDLRL